MEKTYPNHFLHPSAARRYARARPYFHPLVIERVRTLLGLTEPLEAALDVGCGTGQSAQALLAIARQVTAIDPSVAMLAEVPRDLGLVILEGRGEAMPVPSASFDLVSAGMAFQWMKRARFLPETHRVLRPGGHLMIYNNGISGRMLDDPAFKRWASRRSLKSFPIPPNYRYPLRDEQAELYGLSFLFRETYENEVQLSIDALADYLLTQSNVIAHVEVGGHDAEELRRTLLEELSPLFPRPVMPFLFGGILWILHKPPHEARL